jgi:hypothetical protein
MGHYLGTMVVLGDLVRGPTIQLFHMCSNKNKFNIKLFWYEVE